MEIETYELIACYQNTSFLKKSLINVTILVEVN